MSVLIKFLLTAIAVIAFLAIYVIVEVIVTMVVYMYLALNHVDTFGYLIGLSRDLLNLFAAQLEQWSPDLTNQANTTLLGEFAPKSILLLLIGLIVSALGRLIGWGVRRWVHGARSQHA